jgi:hypothetical protein
VHAQLEDFLFIHGMYEIDTLPDGLIIKFFEGLRLDTCLTYKEFRDGVNKLEAILSVNYNVNYQLGDIRAYLEYCRRLQKRMPQKWNCNEYPCEEEWYEFWSGFYW